MSIAKAELTIDERYNRMIFRAFEGKDEISEVAFRKSVGVFHKAIVDIAVKNKIIMAARALSSGEELFFLLPAGLKIQREV